jgi:long-chain acyl-CoA synthetase
MAVDTKRVIYHYTEGDTVGKILRIVAERNIRDNKLALRYKKLGIWNPVSWKKFYSDVRNSALGLVSLGAKLGDKVFIYGNIAPESYAVAYGCACIGMAIAPTWTITRREEVSYIIGHSDCTFILLEGQEQVDRILELKEEAEREAKEKGATEHAFSKVVKAIYWDPKGMWSEEYTKNPFLIELKEVQEMGRKLDQEQPQLFDELIDKVSPDDMVWLGYTSGTTGWPKGAINTQRSNLETVAMMTNTHAVTPDDECFAFAMVEVGALSLPAFIAGFPINIPESMATIPLDLREIGWTTGIVMGIEQQASAMQVRIGDATFLKRLTWRLFKPVGLKKADTMARGEKLNWIWSIVYKIGYFLIFRPIRDKHGLLHATNPYVSMVATSPDVLRLMNGIGVEVRNLYGQNECIPISCTLAGSADSDTAGPPCPGREVRISGEGEIQARGPSAQGYYKNPKATAEFKDDQKWVHTGDAGFITPDGRLVIIDRLAHLMKLKDSTEFSPLFIENKLKFSPYIKQAIITGADADYVGALISIDNDFVSQWAERRQLPYTSSADLSQKQEVYDLIQNDIQERVNKTLPDKTKVKKFALLPKEMDIDDAELTRTFKLRRGYVAERYHDFIEAIYSDVTEHILDIESTYEDGRKARVRVPCKIAIV